MIAMVSIGIKRQPRKVSWGECHSSGFEETNWLIKSTSIEKRNNHATHREYHIIRDTVFTARRAIISLSRYDHACAKVVASSSLGTAGCHVHVHIRVRAGYTFGND
jgi:hypothetical protein